ncbi:PTS sugar transporter subunit IIA [Clostridium tyrobutyricum]|uniref:PTS sugar transporter subunit IIA n=1 Tax=Clostridium tyrobutyricum TaxID=1519 RepID=UPI00057F6BB4|nr:PTS sugar transporter subunit IIA [Clostridium tyrobutyricum]QCH26932.1 PTS system fructose-specific EIIABC component [Clostridium tyrobutyricum]
MEESIGKYLIQDLITCNLEAKSEEDVFKKAYQMLYEKQYVKSSFLKGLIEREKVFPTGIKLEDYGVAIPHTDAVHVLKPAIALIKLKQPVRFQCMDGNGHVDVKLAFVMALKEPHSQILMLQQLMKLIQNKELIEKIFKKDTPESIYNVILESISIKNN